MKKEKKSTTLHILLCFVMTSHMYTIFLLNITSFVINCSAMRNFLDESLDLTKHRAERYSSVNKTVREIEKKIGHTSQLSFCDLLLCSPPPSLVNLYNATDLNRSIKVELFYGREAQLANKVSRGDFNASSIRQIKPKGQTTANPSSTN